MALKWKCIEPVTALGCCWGAYAVGMLDGGITVGAIVGGAKLMQVWGDAKQKFGLSNSSTIKRQQNAIKHRWASAAKGDWLVEADLNAADEMLAKHLLDSIPSPKELGGTIVAKEPYLKKASLLIVDRLSSRADCAIFRETGQEGSSETARNFALEVVEASLEAALAEPEYAEKLYPWFFNEIAQGVHRLETSVAKTQQAVETADSGAQARDAEMAEQLAEIKLLLKNDRLPNDVLSREVYAALDIDPTATTKQLLAKVRRFLDEHRALKTTIAEIKTFDNRLTSIKVAADEALQNYDLLAAADLQKEAREHLNSKILEQAEQSAEFAFTEARTRLLAGDWLNANAAWDQAIACIAPFDARMAANLSFTAAHAYRDYLSSDDTDTDKQTAIFPRWAMAIRYEKLADDHLTAGNLRNALEKCGQAVRRAVETSDWIIIRNSKQLINAQVAAAHTLSILVERFPDDESHDEYMDAFRQRVIDLEKSMLRYCHWTKNRALRDRIISLELDYDALIEVYDESIVGTKTEDDFAKIINLHTEISRKLKGLNWPIIESFFTFCSGAALLKNFDGVDGIEKIRNVVDDGCEALKTSGFPSQAQSLSVYSRSLYTLRKRKEKIMISGDLITEFGKISTAIDNAHLPIAESISNFPKGWQSL